MVEYILVVLVSVIIILGLAQKFYAPLGQFVEGFMGSYVACLLETGELPALGSGEAVTGECSPPPLNAEPGPLSSQTESVAANTGDANRAGRDRSSGENSRGAGSNGGSGGTVGGMSGRRFAVNGGSLSAEGGGDRRKIQIALEGGGSGSFFRTSEGGRSIYRSRSRYVAVSGDLGTEAQRKKEREKGRTLSQKIEDSGGSGVKRKKVMVQPPPARRQEVDEEIRTLDISEIIKYLLIFGIIIALFALLGGQAMQLSKSWEKSGQ